MDEETARIISKMQREIDALKTRESPVKVSATATPTAGKIPIADANGKVDGWITKWTYLTTPLTSTAWDGDAFSTTAKTLIDLSVVFGVPAGVKAVLVRVAIQDSGAAAADCYLVLAPNNTAGAGMATPCIPVNDRYMRMSHVVPCDANGDIYYQIVASGAGTLDVWIQIWGYYI